MIYDYLESSELTKDKKEKASEKLLDPASKYYLDLDKYINYYDLDFKKTKKRNKRINKLDLSRRRNG